MNQDMMTQFSPRYILSSIHIRPATVPTPPANTPKRLISNATHTLTLMVKGGGALFPLKGTYDALEEAAPFVSWPDVKFTPLGWIHQLAPEQLNVTILSGAYANRACVVCKLAGGVLTGTHALDRVPKRCAAVGGEAEAGLLSRHTLLRRVRVRRRYLFYRTTVLPMAQWLHISDSLPSYLTSAYTCVPWEIRECAML